MHILIGGGSGFIGNALALKLRAMGHKVTLISRTSGPERITWNDVGRGNISACDAVVNLWSVPAWLVRALVGSERASILLEGQNVKPKRTLAAGFSFAYGNIDDALDELVKIQF